MLGLCTEKQINTAIGAPEDDVRAHNLLSQMGFSQEIAERDAEKNRQNIEELQREVFGNDRTTYYVRISDVSKKLCLIHYSRNAMKALGAVLRETRDEALKDETSYQAEMITDEYERTDEDMSPRTKNKTRKSKKTQPAVRAARTIKKPFFRIVTVFRDPSSVLVLSCRNEQPLCIIKSGVKRTDLIDHKIILTNEDEGISGVRCSC